MKCPKCQFENREDSMFCRKCGASLEKEIICQSCSSTNPPDSRFCEKCGQDLREIIKASPIDYNRPQSYTPKFLVDKILTTQSTIEGERKQVTVLFADVANYTSMSENLDKVRKDLMRKREGGFLRLLGEVQTKRNKNDSAMTTLNEAIQILKEVENPRQLWQAHASLGVIFSNLNRTSEANKQWGAASDIIQNTAEGLSDRELREGFLNAQPIREILSQAAS